MSWADKFNLLNGLVILRLICGLFFVPHLYAKFFVPEALGEGFGVLQSVKDALDPNGILNPGILIQPEISAAP